MSTRFYLDLAGIPDISEPAADSSWESTAGAGFGRMLLDPVGDPNSSAMTVFLSGISAALNKDILFAKFISQPLAAQTLTGNFTIAVAIGQGASNQDCFLQCVIRVLNSAGTSVRGVAYSGQTATTVSAAPQDANAELRGSLPSSSRVLRNISLSNVTLQAGDRIIVEVGMRCTQSTNAVSGSLYAVAAEPKNDMLAISGRVQNVFERSWIEFSGDLVTLPSNAEEFQFTRSGLILNSSPSLPFVDLETIDGVDNAPVSSATQDREGVHGGYASSEFESLRTITLEGKAYASPTALETYLDQLKANFAPTRRNRDLLFSTDAGDIRMIRARSQGLRYAKTTERRLGVAPFQVQLIADDPRIYERNERTSVLSVSATPQTLTVLGNRETPAIFTISGPITNPQFQLRNQYGILIVNYTGSLIADAAYDINTDTHTIIKDTGTNFRPLVTFSGGWINLAPGPNQITFNGTSATDARLLVTYRGAYR